MRGWKDELYEKRAERATEMAPKSSTLKARERMDFISYLHGSQPSELYPLSQKVEPTTREVSVNVPIRIRRRR
jgi:hypothetical protein